MLYNVQIKRLDPNIEEEILIQVENIEIVCFVNTGIPVSVKLGNFYKVNIGVIVLNDLNMEEQLVQEKKFEQIDNSFAYYIYGKFNFDSRSIDAGILIEFDEKEVDFQKYFYLDNKYVLITVDRITLEFIE